MAYKLWLNKDHQSAKVIRPHDHCHHGISPLQSPTNAATAVSNHSANLSNNNVNVIIDSSDTKSSRISLKFPDYTNFNDVYSNFYSSLRSLQNNADNKDVNDNKTKTDICDISSQFLNENSKSNESIKSTPKVSNSPICKKPRRDGSELDWHRSSSYKDLHREKNVTENETFRNSEMTSKTRYDNEATYEFDFIPLVSRRDGTKKKCYSAATSKNPSIDRSSLLNNMKIYSSSFPGTTSSLSTESVEDEQEDRLVEVFDIKYDSQEEMVLSHDDVSHDSYELLERELDEIDREIIRNKSRKTVGESDRARSSSWGSDRIISPLNYRSTENVIDSEFTKSRDNGFWSLERERSPKHKSETDFRSLDRKNQREPKTQSTYEARRSINLTSQREKQRDLVVDEMNPELEINKKIRDDVLGLLNEISVDREESNMFSQQNLIDKDYVRLLERDSRMSRQCKDLESEYMGVPDRTRYQLRKKSLEKNDTFLTKVDTDDKFINEKQYRLEERKKAEKKREKRDREERFHEGFKEKEQRDREKEKERMQIERKKNIEEKKIRKDEEILRTPLSTCNDYSDFKEIHFKKFDRVVSNQFGKYSEFLTQENKCDLLVQERKVIENYEKVCQVGKIVKEMEKKEKNNFVEFETKSVTSKNILQESNRIKNEEGLESFVKSDQFSMADNDFEKTSNEGFNVVSSPKSVSKFAKTLVERTKSDPYNSKGNLKRHVLIHQKSIDLTPSQSEEGVSDQNNEDKLKKSSRSEHDIPYILHKRHCMNGTAKNIDLTVLKTDIKVFVCSNSKSASLDKEKGSEKTSKDKFSVFGDAITQPGVNESIHSMSSKTRSIESTKGGAQVLNTEAKRENTQGNVSGLKKSSQIQYCKPPIGKKPLLLENKSLRNMLSKEFKKMDLVKSSTETDKDSKENRKVEIPADKTGKVLEPIYAEVCKDKIETGETLKNIPPEPPKRTSSIQQKFNWEENKVDLNKIDKHADLQIQNFAVPEPCRKNPIEFSDRIIPSQKANTCVSPKRDHDNSKFNTSKSKAENSEEMVKTQPVLVRGMQDLIGSVHHRRKESLILFARTRLGLSEGSAFAPVPHKTSPTNQRRTKSLDAPYVSVHRLPPVDAFSSKDDTLDGNDVDIVKSAGERMIDFSKVDLKISESSKGDEAPQVPSILDEIENVESDGGTLFPDKVEIEANIKKWTESQAKLELSFGDEKVLDSIRSKRLLSKIESVDGVDSEGDMDSSKLTDALPIPLDRLVNLPESVRFPSVRQISGQTSEESADGWEQKEVKVKRRTPRRSVGRDEPEVGAKESVVWDSKDDEFPDDEVWDDNLVFTRKYGSSIVTDAVVPVEYLKRGSCGQSIDDDNLSTPMKESSPEHWVSVDDLPEAIEKEEKLLRQQEKILREKILNEKLKRELNLDTIDVDEKFYEYKGSSRQSFEAEPVDIKGKFKGHSLDTYELTEKKLRDRGTSKYCSLDEHMLREKSIKNYVPVVSNFDGRLDISSETLLRQSVDSFSEQDDVDYIQCKLVNDLREIDQFGVDNDEELEEFFVVFDEKSENEKDIKSIIWEDPDIFKRSLSKEESVISVPEEFRDEEYKTQGAATLQKSKDQSSDSEIKIEEKFVKDNQALASGFENKPNSAQERSTLFLCEVSKDPESTFEVVPEKLSLHEGDRRSSEDQRKVAGFDEAGRLSPYDCSFGRYSNDPRRLSASDEPDRLSPFNDSRRGSEEPRRLSSEDSRKYSISESVSEETRRRLSSTEETRRKRASLTKQWSVGADSLSDEMISGVPECSSSFEHDEEKDVFESEPVISKSKEITEYPAPESTKINCSELFKKTTNENKDPRMINEWGLEVFHETSLENEIIENVSIDGRDEVNRLIPPPTAREHSRETEDSVDYCEEFTDLRDSVKEKDISETEPECFNFQLQTPQVRETLDKVEFSDTECLSFIDEKKDSISEDIVTRNRKDVSFSIITSSKTTEKFSYGDDTGRTVNLENFKLEGESSRTKKTSGADVGHFEVLENTHRKLAKAVSNTKTASIPFVSMSEKTNSLNNSKSSFDSSQDSDIDKLGEISLISHVQNQIAKRNLSDTGKRLRYDEIDVIEKNKFCSLDGSDCKILDEKNLILSARTSSDELEKTESSSFEGKSNADDLNCFVNGKRKNENKNNIKHFSEVNKVKTDSCVTSGKEKKISDQEKRDSGEDGSSSSSAPPYPRRELSSTWKPFLLESSGSSSLEENWLPPDDNAHLADEEETSSTSNNQQDESCHDDVDYPTGVGYPVLNISSAEMIVGGYGGIYALSRTLSRISERSTSEQERSDLEDDFTKPSSHSVSVEEESMLSSDRQPSLSSDPPSLRGSAGRIPDLPDDRTFTAESIASREEKTPDCEPFGGIIPPPLRDDDWPSPASSCSVFDGVGVSHIETVYLEIYPEEACKVVVAEPQNNGGNSSSDENQTLHEEGELLHLSSDNISVSTTTTTQDGTIIVPVRRRSVRTASISEDTSMVSISEWSSSTVAKPRANFGISDDYSERTKTSALTGTGGKIHSQQNTDELTDYSTNSLLHSGTDEFQTNRGSAEVSRYESDTPTPKTIIKMKPPQLKSPTGKIMGFFETPVSKVRSPTSQSRFFETEEGFTTASTLRSPTSRSESSSPKNLKRFFESPTHKIAPNVAEAQDVRFTRGTLIREVNSPKEKKFQHGSLCAPYYSNVADSAEKSFFGRYDTGSLERTKIIHSRKCSSYYSMSKTVPDEEDSSNSDELRGPTSNTIPRASKKTKKRHRVAMDLEIRDGRIVAPPKTQATVIENTDSDRSSPRESRENRKKHSDV